MQRNHLTGVGWMILTGLCFIATNGFVRALGPALPAAESAFIRFGIGLVFLGPALAGQLRTGFPAQVWRLFLLRGAFHVCAVVLWFFAMARITVAEVTAIGFLNPIVVTVGAALFLGERLGWRRMLAIALALAGALIVLRPGLRDLASGHMAQVGASVFFGLSYIVAKRLSGMVSATTVVAMLSLTVGIGLAPLAAVVWVPPAMEQLALLTGAALAGTMGHYCMIRAFAAAPLTVTQPVTFLQLIWASLLGIVAFGEPLDIWVIVGGGVMIAAISWITWREARLGAQGTRGPRPALAPQPARP